MVDKHGICQEFLGQHHDPANCFLCSSLAKKASAKREIVREVWINSGVFMSRSQVVAYLKQKGLDHTFKERFDVSFQALNVSLTPSLVPCLRPSAIGMRCLEKFFHRSRLRRLDEDQMLIRQQTPTGVRLMNYHWTLGSQKILRPCPR